MQLTDGQKALIRAKAPDHASEMIAFIEDSAPSRTMNINITLNISLARFSGCEFYPIAKRKALLQQQQEANAPLMNAMREIRGLELPSDNPLGEVTGGTATPEALLRLLTNEKYAQHIRRVSADQGELLVEGLFR